MVGLVSGLIIASSMLFTLASAFVIELVRVGLVIVKLLVKWIIIMVKWLVEVIVVVIIHKFKVLFKHSPFQIISDFFIVYSSV